MAINEWSTVAANNASGVTGVNWAEGQAPSTVNDSARAVMADVAAWYGQAKIPEYLTGVAGTNTITATGQAAMAAYAAGQRFMFIPAATNTGATTLNITPSGGAALGAKNIFWTGAACSGGELVISVPVVVVYDGTQFNVIGPKIGTRLTNSLGGNVALNNTANYFDGPSVAQGTVGTWLAFGTVTVYDTAAAAGFSAKLWDGTTVIASTAFDTSGSSTRGVIALSGYISSPAGNIRISVKDTSSTNGQITSNTSSNSKDSTISVVRIA